MVKVLFSFLISERTDVGSVALVSTQWDGETWSNPESTLLGYDWMDGDGVTAALLPSGKLVAVFRVFAPVEGSGLLPLLGSVQRKVEIQPITPLPTFTPQPVVTVMPTFIPLPTLTSIPTPIDTVTQTPDQSGINWSLVGAIIAGVVILGLIILIIIQGLNPRSKIR